MKDKKIIFIGCVEFSNFFLKEMLNNKVNVIGVCTKKKSKFKSDFSNLSLLAKDRKIPYIFWDKNTDEKKIFDWISEKKPDYIFCIGWPQLLKKKILQIPKYFCVGFHPSDLPHNRGRHPIIWSIILNFKKIASTFFIMSEYADNGLILLKNKISLKKNETSQTLFDKLFLISKKQIPHLLKKISALGHKKNSYEFLFKNNQLSNSLRKRDKNDGIIDWRMSAKNIDALIRALSKPYDGACFYHKNRLYKVLQSKVYKSKNQLEPGKIINKLKNNLIIQTGENLIELSKIIPKIKIKKGDYLQ